MRGTISALQREFSLSDLGQLHHFLGKHVQPHDGGLFLSQRQYMLDILARAEMSECKPCITPTRILLGAEGVLVWDATDFRSLASALQYLTFTRPDIAYAIQQYIRGTLDLGLVLRPSASPDLVVYSEAHWAGCPDTRKSTSGYAVFLGDNLVTVSRSSAATEYRAVANAVAEASWLLQLLLELHAPLRRSTLVYCDNISIVYMASKHIEIDLHFVRDHVALGEVRVLHVPTSLQFADIFTKGLPSPVSQSSDLILTFAKLPFRLRGVVTMVRESMEEQMATWVVGRKDVQVELRAITLVSEKEYGSERLD
ncbi:LOW QUALITY PROTEIN: hypothetical protein U9M48_042216 [Paspalum notatum var. saurae]|uniref:Reverse transcriptase Ty1/copia-type domain-containing protein n=1 Tax=Paspalum notatum var. saurae TaxID=547442 RepID=A0AAQ3UQP6_PASNO